MQNNFAVLASYAAIFYGIGALFWFLLGNTIAWAIKKSKYAAYSLRIARGTLTAVLIHPWLHLALWIICWETRYTNAFITHPVLGFLWLPITYVGCIAIGFLPGWMLGKNRG